MGADLAHLEGRELAHLGRREGAPGAEEGVPSRESWRTALSAAPGNDDPHPDGAGLTMLTHRPSVRRPALLPPPPPPIQTDRKSVV